VAADVIAAQARNFSRSMGVVGLRVATVGQPTLESWRSVVADQAAARRLRMRLLGNSERPALLYFGGYGAGYNESVRLLAQGIARGGPLSGFDCLLTPHPGQGGRGLVEREIFKSTGLGPGRVQIVTGDVASSPEVAACVNVTASDDSTCGVQSLFIGVPSMYIDAASGSSYTDVAVNRGLIPVVRTVKGLSQFTDVAAAEGWQFDTRRLRDAGIPSDSAQRIADEVGFNNL